MMDINWRAAPNAAAVVDTLLLLSHNCKDNCKKLQIVDSVKYCVDEVFTDKICKVFNCETNFVHYTRKIFWRNYAEVK
jgi:hypothetical protein